MLVKVISSSLISHLLAFHPITFNFFFAFPFRLGLCPCPVISGYGTQAADSNHIHSSLISMHKYPVSQFSFLRNFLNTFLIQLSSTTVSTTWNRRSSIWSLQWNTDFKHVNITLTTFSPQNHWESEPVLWRPQMRTFGSLDRSFKWHKSTANFLPRHLQKSLQTFLMKRPALFSSLLAFQVCLTRARGCLPLLWQNIKIQNTDITIVFYKHQGEIQIRNNSKEKHRRKADRGKQTNKQKTAHKGRTTFTSEDLDYYLDQTVDIPPASWCLDWFDLVFGFYWNCFSRIDLALFGLAWLIIVIFGRFI